jgi:hypothetical protein
MSSTQPDNDKPTAGSGWMKVSRPHKALPQVPNADSQPTSGQSNAGSATSTPGVQSPASQSTPIGSPQTNNLSNSGAKWRIATKVPEPKGGSSDSNSSANSDTNGHAQGRRAVINIKIIFIEFIFELADFVTLFQRVINLSGTLFIRVFNIHYIYRFVVILIADSFHLRYATLRNRQNEC